MTGTAPEYPLAALDRDGSLTVVPEPFHLGGMLEPVDVALGEYQGFDASGRRVDFTLVGGHVQVDLRQDDPVSQGEAVQTVIAAIRSTSTIDVREFGPRSELRDLLEHVIRSHT